MAVMRSELAWGLDRGKHAEAPGIDRWTPKKLPMRSRYLWHAMWEIGREHGGLVVRKRQKCRVAAECAWEKWRRGAQHNTG